MARYVKRAVPAGPRAMVDLAGDHYTRYFNEVIALDLETREIARRHEAPLAPLDVALAPEGDALLVSQFAGASIVRLELADGATRAVASPGEGPSLFSRPGKRGARYLVSEHADVVTEIAPDGAPLRRWETGDRPYPGDVTSDGILLFVPNRDEGSVTVVDTLNDRIAATTPVGEQPTPEDGHDHDDEGPDLPD